MHHPGSSSNTEDSSSDLDIDIMVTDPDGLVLSPFTGQEGNFHMTPPNRAISGMWRVFDFVGNIISIMMRTLLSWVGGVVNIIPIVRVIRATYNWWTTPRMPENVPKPKNKNIFILGDQHAVDLAFALSDSRCTRGDGYKVIDRTELNNECYQVLEECQKLSQRDAPDDIFVIYIGANDRFAQHIYKEIKNMLQALLKFKLVLLVKVQYNAHDRTNMINQNLKAIVVEYPNCVFVDIDSEHDFTNEEFSNSNFILSLCDKINEEIDSVLEM